MRKRVSRVDGQRSERGKYFAYEVLAEAVTVPLVQFIVMEDMNVRLPELWQEIVLPTTLMSLRMNRQVTAYRQHLFRRRHGVGGSLACPSGDLTTETRDSDHEEFVEVRREDRKELDSLQKRVTCIFGFFQHA
jgi:hypothetical protein